MADLRQNVSYLPDIPGVYVVVRTSVSAPVFLECGSGGYFKGRNPNVEIPVLEKKWIGSEAVVYIGKAGTSLRRRINDYLRFGAGRNVGHWGGRYIWQLADHENLLFCWKILSGADEAASVEEQMIIEFSMNHYGQLPFANLKM